MIRKYIRRCKQLFPIYGKYERQFLKRLQQQANEFIEQNPNLTYEELVTQFGSPKDIAVGYYDTIDDNLRFFCQQIGSHCQSYRFCQKIRRWHIYKNYDTIR